MPMSNQPPEEEVSYQAEVLPRESSLARPEEEGRWSLSYREGPITPDELREYNQLVPGFSQDYLHEVIQEVRHHREIDREKLEIEKAELVQEGEIIKVQERIFNSNQRRSILGSIAGFIIALTAIGSATFLGLQGHEVAATAVVGSLAASAAVIYGTDAYNKNRQKELESNESDEEAKKPHD